MGLLDLLLVAVGLSMDAFAVSVCKGLNTKISLIGKACLVPFSAKWEMYLAAHSVSLFAFP